MPQSLVQLYTHVVFSTKQRKLYLKNTDSAKNFTPTWLGRVTTSNLRP